MAQLRERWSELDLRTRRGIAVGGPIALYLIAVFALGSPGFVREKAPIGIVALGVIYGTVTALGAMGIILVYRANRFINFAYGALGSLVGVICIGMVLEHGMSYWLRLPIAIVVGALIGALTEFTVIRRFQNSTRLVLTVASIGLAQLLGGLELLGSQKIRFTSLAGGFRG